MRKTVSLVSGSDATSASNVLHSEMGILPIPAGEKAGALWSRLSQENRMYASGMTLTDRHRAAITVTLHTVALVLYRLVLPATFISHRILLH